MDYFSRVSEIAKQANYVDNKHYHYYKVKRGLRNADGSGVLVGLTNVSTVIGYEKVDEEIVPKEGRLYYRGIEVKDLVRGFEMEERYGFEETVFLLFFGKLPNSDELTEFKIHMAKMRNLRINFPRDVLQTFRTPDIMNALARSVLVLYGIDDDPDNLEVPNQVRQAMDLVAKVSTIVPYAYYSIQHGFYNKSLIIHSPDDSLSAAQNFLHLMRPDSKFTEIEARALDMLLVLHADHGGGNNSTFTTRVVSSTGTDFFSAIAAAIGSLKGPLHGGANVRAARMMSDLKANVSNVHSRDEIRDYLFKLLKGEVFDRAGKIYGIGHAVYTLSDPRTVVLREYAKLLAEVKGLAEDFELHELVEKEAPLVLAEYKNQEDLAVSANVDFYSGFIYRCLDIPMEIYTPFFAMARTAGWAAHRLELMCNSERLMRPAYKSLGGLKNYVPLNERT
jgi:citrate synthase